MGGFVARGERGKGVDSTEIRRGAGGNMTGRNSGEGATGAGIGVAG